MFPGPYALRPEHRSTPLRAPYGVLSLSLSLGCGFYNQIRVDVSPRIRVRTRAATHRPGLLSRIYVLRLMWAVGSDDKCVPERPNAPTAPPQSAQPDFVNRLTRPSFLFYCVCSFVRSNTPWTQLTTKLDKRHPETTALLGFACTVPLGSFLNINIVSARSQLSASLCCRFTVKTNYRANFAIKIYVARMKIISD